MAVLSNLRGSLLLLVLSTILLGCAGYRSGYMLAPYFEGTTPPAARPSTVHEIHQSRTLMHEGVELTINLGEDSRTSDYTVVLAVVPTSVELGSQDAVTSGGQLKVGLSLMTKQKSLTFRPDQIRLSVNGASLPLRAARMDSPRSQNLALSSVTQLSPQSFVSFELVFDSPSVRFEDTVKLDLSDALNGFNKAMPEIRFQKTKWRYGYT